RLTAVYRRGHRYWRRLWHLDIDRLSDRRNHCHPAYKLSEPSVFAAPLFTRQRGAIPTVLGPVRAGAQPGRDDRLPGATRLFRWGHDPARLHHRDDHAAALE